MPHALQHTVFKDNETITVQTKKITQPPLHVLKKLSLRVHIRQGQCYGIANICE
jgi:hypothetical protein